MCFRATLYPLFDETFDVGEHTFTLHDFYTMQVYYCWAQNVTFNFAVLTYNIQGADEKLGQTLLKHLKY